MKNKLIFLFAFLLLFTSCATLINRPVTSTVLHLKDTTQSNYKVIYQKDTFNFTNKKLLLVALRQKCPLQFTVLADSVVRAYSVKSKLSSAMWLNIFNYGIGALIDLASIKKYDYPKNLYLYDVKQNSKLYRLPRSQKGDVMFHISLPHINSYYMEPEGKGVKTNTGFWGIMGGLDYYHTSNQYLNLSYSAELDFFIPVPAAVDFSGEYELMNSQHIQLTNNHLYGRFSLGYGLSAVKNAWHYNDVGDYNKDGVLIHKPSEYSAHYAFGLNFNAYYRFTRCFYTGIIYRPTFITNQSNAKWQYEHLISIDFAWKIPLFNIDSRSR